MTRIALALALITLIATIGCGGGDTGETEAVIHPTWITAQLEGNTVSIPVSELDSGKMLHFRVTYQDASMAFMAYQLDGENYVRANVCPPCRSVGFNLEGDTLVCNSCGTRFEAGTGKGISGGCRDYPKAGVAYAVSGEKVTMEIKALATAYENTIKSGWP